MENGKLYSFIQQVFIECLLGTGILFFTVRIYHRHKVPALIELTFCGETSKFILLVDKEIYTILGVVSGPLEGRRK